MVKPKTAGAESKHQPLQHQYTTFSDYSVNNKEGSGVTRNTKVTDSLLKTKKTKKYMPLKEDVTDTMRNSHRNGNEEYHQFGATNSDLAANTVQKSHEDSSEGRYPEQMINLVKVSPPKII